MFSVLSNNLSLKYYRFTPSGCNDIGIRKFEICDKDLISFDEPFLILGDI